MTETSTSVVCYWLQQQQVSDFNLHQMIQKNENVWTSKSKYCIALPRINANLIQFERTVDPNNLTWLTIKKS